VGRSPGRFAFFQKSANGVGTAEVLRADEFDENPTAWSPDGRFIMYIRRAAGTSNLWVLPLEGDRKPVPITNTQFNTAGSFSPDGRWVVYASLDTGRMEIYVAPFPGPGPKDAGIDQRRPRSTMAPTWRDSVPRCA
jgi:eukaryotic-like serine/threonine-protein kinase